MPKNYTVREAGEIFKRSDDTIRRWIAEGFFEKVFKVKDGYLIPEDSIKKALEKNSLM